MGRNAIMMNNSDNVITALSPLPSGARAEYEVDGRDAQVIVQQEIPFGHKVAVRDISADEPVLKYGLPIGQALVEIKAGHWVHVHNCRSDRFGHRHEKYGINA